MGKYHRLQLQLSLCVLLYKSNTESETRFNSKMNADYSEGPTTKYYKMKNQILRSFGFANMVLDGELKQ